MQQPAGWRLELFFKSTAELHARVMPLLRACAIRRVNLTNKARDDQLLEAARVLCEELPGIDICLHYSIKHNYRRTPDASFKRLEEFAQELSTLSTLGGRTSVLLVSGGGQKRPLDSVQALQRASRRTPFLQLGLPFFVAFNPYLPDPEEQREERARLRAKVLESRGLVRGVYLQMGSDVGMLRSGLEFLQQVQAETAATAAEQGEKRRKGSPAPQLQLLGSVFIPSKRLLAQMRFRPWVGVFLSERYLGSVDAAEAITRELVGLYAEYGVAVLVESAVRTEAEMARACDLLQLPPQ